jgi:hypothetical protein
MSFRVSALVSVATVLGLSAVTPARAQPQVPYRPQYSAFSGLFYPNQQLLFPGAFGGGGFGQQGAFGGVGGFMNGFGGPQVPGFVYPGTLTYPQNQPIIFTNNPNLATTGVVAKFNNLGHWYGSSTAGGGLGHWYPNGWANGRGVLGPGFGYGAGGAYGGGLGTTTGGFGGAPTSTAGSALTAPAVVNPPGGR